VGQRAIVGEEEEARGGGVEAAYRDEAGEGRHQVSHGRSVEMGFVFEGGEVAGGFVEGEVGEALGQLDGAAVEQDAVPLGGDVRAEGGCLTVHRHPAG
jgi:hypothetical protein